MMQIELFGFPKTRFLIVNYCGLWFTLYTSAAIAVTMTMQKYLSFYTGRLNLLC